MRLCRANRLHPKVDRGIDTIIIFFFIMKTFDKWQVELIWSRKREDKCNSLNWLPWIESTKTFTNFKRIDKDGEHIFDGFKKDEYGNILDNLLIKWDNLPVLHSLKNNFYQKIKLIYIDPPYNTWKTTLQYNDKFTHPEYLTFMKNRLEVARELLRDDGVIFISIDDDEQAYLKVLMDEIFGRANFIANFIWTRKKKGSFLSKKVRKMTEFVVCYTKTLTDFCFYGENAYSDKQQPIVKRTNSVKTLKIPKNIIQTSLEDGKYEKGLRGSDETGIRFLMDFSVKNGMVIDEVEIKGKFVWSQEFLDEEIKNGSQISLSKKFGLNVLRHDQSEKIKTPSTLINSENGVGTNEDATKEIADMFDAEIGTIFNYNKPVSLLQYLINMTTYNDPEAIVLDYHAGSGTTAHAVLELNKKDGGNRQFVLVEQMDYIEDITKVRLQKVIEWEQGGISKSTDWRGGGFVYMEISDKFTT